MLDHLRVELDTIAAILGQGAQHVVQAIISRRVAHVCHRHILKVDATVILCLAEDTVDSLYDGPFESLSALKVDFGRIEKARHLRAETNQDIRASVILALSFFQDSFSRPIEVSPD